MDVPGGVNNSLMFGNGTATTVLPPQKANGNEDPLANCIPDPYVSGWALRQCIVNFIIVFIGAIGCTLSLWSLFRCRKTNLAAKIHLGIFFGVQLIACLLTLPVFSYVKRLALLCQIGDLSSGVKVLFLFTLLPFQSIERVNFAALAIIRLIAVRWPLHYRKFARVRVVIVMEILIFLYVLTPWLVYFVINTHNSTVDHLTIMFSKWESRAAKGIHLMNGLHLIFPTFASLLAYSLMMYTMFRQNQAMEAHMDQNATTMDHIAYTVRLVILINLLLDVPHAIFHLLGIGHVPSSLIIHSIFYTHLALDPFIFVFMNAHYRRSLVESIRACFCCKGRIDSDMPQGLEVPAQKMDYLKASHSNYQTRSGGTEFTNDSGVSNV